ncbi:MAG: hypothetical protein QXP36_02865 [Conexivisphaerales archaeon]
MVPYLYPLNQKWFWQLFLILLIAVLAPLVIFYIIMVVAPYAIVIMLLVAVFVWVIFRSYRRWVSLEKEKNEGEAHSEGVSDVSK